MYKRQALTGNTAFTATNDFDNVQNIEAITLGNTNTAVTIVTQDTLVAAAATLTLTNAANSGALTFNGGAETNGAFNITGGSGNDNIMGGTGNDTLIGGSGDDALTGSRGNDSIAGGLGADTFSFGVGDSGLALGAIDTVADFTTGVDHLDFGGPAGTIFNFSDLLGVPVPNYNLALSAANVAMSFAANLGLSLPYVFATDTTDGWVFVDNDLDGIADLSIELTGVNSIVATDIAGV